MRIMIHDLRFKIGRWIGNNRAEFVLLLIILLIGAFFRLYRIDEYMVFLGDEGRDVIIVRRLLVNFDPILVGPGTSIGNMYLGPLYYYMMAPALVLANFSPVGPAIMIALLGVATIFFVWYAARTLFPTIYSIQGRTLQVGALAAALLYAISPTAIIFSRSSWNPNIMPFFALLTTWSVWKVWKEQNFMWLIILGISFAFVLNSHYLGLLLLPVIFVYLLKSFVTTQGRDRVRFIKYFLISLGIFAFLMSPLVIFDARHEFRNFKAMQEFVIHRESSFKGIGEAVSSISMVYTNMFTRLIGGRNEIVGFVVAVVAFILSTIMIYINVVRRKFSSPILLVFLWIVVGVVGLAFVEREIYDHYMGFLFPAPFLLLAALAKETQYLILKTKNIKYLVFSIQCLVLGLLVIANIASSPLKDNPSRQLQRSIAVAKKIIEEASGERFNLAVLAESNYEDGYKYFLEYKGADVKHADIWDKSTISDILFVVCEKPKDECKPSTDSKAEVANFGMSEIDEEWEVGGVVLYKLVHTKI